MQEPQCYWIWELFGSDPLKLTPNEARAVHVALSKQHEIVKVRGEIINTRAHKRLRRSDERIIPGVVAIESGAIDRIKPEPVYNDAGAILWRWAKKIMTEREFNRRGRFAGRKIGESDEGNFIVAFHQIVFKPEVLPEGVQWCTAQEVAQLEIAAKY